VGEVELPPLGPNASVGLWFEVPDYRDVEYGVVRMGGVDEAAAAIRNGLGGAGMPPHADIAVESEDCSCGGC
jgi:hypothetical protein